MHYTGLHDCLGPHPVHRVGQPSQAVADHHAHIGGAPVLDLGQNVRPVLGARSALADPDAENVGLAVHSHRRRHVDRPVGHLAVTDLHLDAVDEQHRVDPIKRTGLPLRHPLRHRVG